MGIVTDHLFDLIEKQVNQHGLVVWYDPDMDYADAIPHVGRLLEEDGIAFAKYDGSFFALRHEIEPYLVQLKPPRLVIYVPLGREEADYALVESETAGVVIQPGQQPPTRNTRLAIVGRNALTEALGGEMAGKIEKQVEQGKLTLADLDAIADKGGEITEGVTTVIFGTGNPQEVALQFLAHDKFDAELQDKEAIPELALLLESSYGVQLPSEELPQQMRRRFARFVLVSDLAWSLGGKLPEKLTAVPSASDPQKVNACRQLADAWRRRLDLRDTYAEATTRVEQELGIGQIDVAADALVAVDTFLAVEHILLHKTIESLLDGHFDRAVETASERQSHFWAEYRGDVQAEWALIETCGQVLRQAKRIERELRSSPKDATALLQAYVNGAEPWCLLDTYHRHMERRHHNFEFHFMPRHRALDQLVVKSRQRYMTVAAQLTERFTEAFEEAGYHLDDVRQQTEIYETQIAPSLGKQKTAYICYVAVPLTLPVARSLAPSG